MDNKAVPRPHKMLNVILCDAILAGIFRRGIFIA